MAWFSTEPRCFSLFFHRTACSFWFRLLEYMIPSARRTTSRALLSSSGSYSAIPMAMCVHLRLNAFNGGCKSALVLDRGQCVHIYPLVQVADMVFHMIGKPLEGTGQSAHLVVFAVIQREIVISPVHFLCGAGEFLQRLCDAACIIHGKQAQYQQHFQRSDDDLTNQRLPVAVCFIDRYADGQAHAIAQRQPRPPLFHAIEGVANKGIAAEQALRGFRKLIGRQYGSIIPCINTLFNRITQAERR